MYQWNKTELPEGDPHIDGQLFFDKCAKASLWKLITLALTDHECGVHGFFLGNFVGWSIAERA